MNSLNWMVVYTYSKFEYKVEKELTKLQIETFLPTHDIVKQWSDRKKRLTVPLFPNYLFVRVPINESWKVLATQGVVKFLSEKEEPCFISNHIIASIRKACLSTVEVTSQSFNKGDVVDVISGPLIGAQGVLVEKKGRTRLAISIDLIKQSVLAEVNVEDLKKKPILIS